MAEEKTFQERARLKELPTSALLHELEEAQKELFNLRCEVATLQIKNPARIRKVRNQVARIKTILRERELLGVGK